MPEKLTPEDLNDEFEVRDFLALDRTVLANERTILAYIRTFIGLVAAGVGLIKVFETPLFSVFGIICIVAGFVTIVFGIRRYTIVRRKMVEVYKTGQVRHHLL